jgi:hypothetical protein
MSFTLTPEEALIQQTAKEFADKELAPIASKIDRNGEVPRTILDKMASLGFLGMLTPEAYGGAALSNLALALVQLEINRACASTGVTMSVHNSLCQSPILKFGTDEQKQKYLPRLARGEWIGASSLIGARQRHRRRRAHHHRDPRRQRRRDQRDQELRHQRRVRRPVRPVRPHQPRARGEAVGNQRVPRRADLQGAHRRQEREEDGHPRLVDDDALPRQLPGSRVEPAGQGGRRLQDRAQHARRRPDRDRLTGDGHRDGLPGRLRQYARGRSSSTARSATQAIQWKIAEMATDIDAAKLLIYRAARMRDAGEPHTKEASMAKLFASTMANRHANQAVQIHGGVGYIKDFPVERYFRDAKITEIYEGTSEVQRMVVARSLLK